MTENIWLGISPQKDWNSDKSSSRVSACRALRMVKKSRTQRRAPTVAVQLAVFVTYHQVDHQGFAALSSCLFSCTRLAENLTYLQSNFFAVRIPNRFTSCSGQKERRKFVCARFTKFFSEVQHSMYTFTRLRGYYKVVGLCSASFIDSNAHV